MMILLIITTTMTTAVSTMVNKNDNKNIDINRKKAYWKSRIKNTLFITIHICVHDLCGQIAAEFTSYFIYFTVILFLMFLTVWYQVFRLGYIHRVKSHLMNFSLFLIQSASWAFMDTSWLNCYDCSDEVYFKFNPRPISSHSVKFFCICFTPFMAILLWATLHLQ